MYGLNGSTLRKQYKETISSFRTWGQLEHAEEYVLHPENVTENLSLDETCLSNGEVYSVLTSKEAHGKKGALVAMVRGVASDVVVKVLRKIPEDKRSKVKTITTDLSSSMMLTARRAFPSASLINDRFHVQQLMNEAVDTLRIELRWKVLEEENKAIEAWRRERQQAKSTGEKPSRWEPKRMSNGETLPQIMARSRHLILQHSSKWNETQCKRAEILFETFPTLKKAYELSLALTEIFNKKSTIDAARLNLAKWYNQVEAFGCTVFNKVTETFKNHTQTILNYFSDRLTNASAESFNAKIKTLRSQFRGVRDIPFFMFRLSTLYS